MMKGTERFLNGAFARATATVLFYFCRLYVFFSVLFLILIFSGRQSFYLHTDTGSVRKVTYAQADQEQISGGMTVSVKDEIHVWANEKNGVDLTTHLGISFLAACTILTTIAFFCFLGLVCSHVRKGMAVTARNARCLLACGLIRFGAVLVVPYLKQLVCVLSNMVSDSQITVGVASGTARDLLLGSVFLLAAYAVHCEVRQKEKGEKI